MLKVIRLVKVFSAFIFLIILLWIYAYMPIMVKLDPEATIQIHKETFFYYTLSLFVALNILLIIIQSLINRNIQLEILQAWIGGFTFVFNLYLTFLVGFLGVLNNPSSVSVSGYAYLNWLGPIMIFCWFGGLIFIIQKRNKMH